MKEGLIGVIVPVYNTEKYIRKCLDSIIAQTYTNWEAILVDDGSTDNCGKICDEYAAKDKRFKVIHQENQGVVIARENAISCAKGEYLAFVDSDDYIEPVMFEEMFYKAHNEKLDIVWCNLNWIYNCHSMVESIQIKDDNHDNIKNLLTSKLPGYLWNKLINRYFWEKANIHTDKCACMWEDTYISIQLLLNNPRNGYINKEFYYYNKANEKAATANNNLIIKAQKNIENIYKFLVKENKLEVYYDEFCNMALKLKIGLLKTEINKAFSIYPFAHKRLKYYNLSRIPQLFYYINFNTGHIGKIIFRLYFAFVKKYPK